MTLVQTKTMDETRIRMKEYWQEHSNSSLENMMLDSNAKTLNQLEMPEILEKAPDMQDKDVLELAAGIGRYTSVIAEKAKSVTAVEFMPEFHKSNVEHNGNKPNVELMCDDVTKVELKAGSYDVIFSNWLLMYLDDNEVLKFAEKALKWLRPGGKLFFRESCFRQSGDTKRSSNPTYYRHPNFYLGVFGSVAHQSSTTGQVEAYDLVGSSSVGVYRKVKKNPGQLWFLYEKVDKKSDQPIEENSLTFQKFLDSHQYSEKSITRYEKIFGKGYVSTGGQSTTTEFVNKLNLKKGEKVLDVGCGIGGGNFYMAEKYGVSVLGIDLSANMVLRAIENSMEKPDLDVTFEIADATKVEYAPNSFDVIYSRDTILHIEDKKSLFTKFYRWLRPGGRVLISDYCRGSKSASENFKAYLANRGYHLHTPEEYGKILESAGFSSVVAEDRTEQFIGVLKAELERTEKSKDEFIRETSEEDYNDIVNGWRSKIVRCGDGDQKWGLFYAEKH